MVEREFKEILSDFLKTLGLTQTTFAQKIDCKQSQVSEWLKGKAKPGYDILKRISVAFDVQSDYLLGISSDF